MRWILWCFCLLAESYETINHYHYLASNVYAGQHPKPQHWVPTQKENVHWFIRLGLLYWFPDWDPYTDKLSVLIQQGCARDYTTLLRLNHMTIERLRVMAQKADKMLPMVLNEWLCNFLQGLGFRWVCRISVLVRKKGRLRLSPIVFSGYIYSCTATCCGYLTFCKKVLIYATNSRK